MCMLKSGLLFRASVYVPDHDHHDKMLKEKGIEDTAENRIAGKLVRFELSPSDGDPFAPVDTWKFKVDQDEIPEWLTLNLEKYENMARNAVEKWAKKHIYIGVTGLEITEGCAYYLKDCQDVTLRGNSIVKAMQGNSTVNAMLDNSIVNAMWDNSTVKAMWDNSTVKAMRGNSIVKAMQGNSTVKAMRDNSTVNAMLDNSTVKAMWDNSTVKAMWDNSTVNAMWDNSIVNAMWDNSIVNAMLDNSIVNAMLDNAVGKDYRTKTIYCAEGWKVQTH